VGYLIRYDPENDKKYPIHKHTRRQTVLVLGCVIALLIGLMAIWSQELRMLLIPGDPYVTQAAFTEMVSEVRQGEPVLETVTAFCRQILEVADAG